MTYAPAPETRTTESGAERLDALVRSYPPEKGWVWGARHLAHALDLSEPYLVNSATPGFFLALGANTLCPVSSWDPAWGRDRVLLTHESSLGAWWGDRVLSIGLARLENAGFAGQMWRGLR
jgi:hypothetical protein